MSLRITRYLEPRLDCVERCYNEREHYHSSYGVPATYAIPEKKQKKQVSIMTLVDRFMALKEEKIE